uniref:Uncharacterized protein n=1 Tax=Romanomermis culicivorax TaxID=13658 RepID=A0A915KYY4_ROMCU
MIATPDAPGFIMNIIPILPINPNEAVCQLNIREAPIKLLIADAKDVAKMPMNISGGQILIFWTTV